MQRTPYLFLILFLVVSVAILLLLLIGTATYLAKPPVPLIFSPDQLPAARIGQPYTTSITISNNSTPVGKMSLADGALPPGLILRHTSSNSTAEIGGIPVESGDFKFTISAWCYGTNTSGQTGQQAYTLTVK